MGEEWCEVRALPPAAVGGEGERSSVAASGQYRCSTDGKFTVTLSRAQRFKGWILVADQTFDAPRSAEWSAVLQGPAADCVNVPYASTVAHVHGSSSDTSARSESRPCSSSR